jgi:RNA polymerase sigma factor (sigma-70 family)
LRPFCRAAQEPALRLAARSGYRATRQVGRPSLKIDIAARSWNDRSSGESSRRRDDSYLCSGINAAINDGRPLVTATSWQPWPNDRVIRAAQQGDPDAIAVLVSGSHQHVKRFARTLCPTPEDAEDAAQEALITLYRKIGTLRATAALASWMFQIVRNECIRRTRFALREPIAAAVDERSAEDAALARIEIERIVSSIAELPPEQRAVLILRDVQGFSGAATAQALGLSRAAMKSRLHRARKQLHAQLSVARDAGAVTPVQ